MQMHTFSAPVHVLHARCEMAMRSCCAPASVCRDRRRTVCAVGSSQRPAQTSSRHLDAAVVQRLVRCVRSRPEAGAAAQALNDAGVLVQEGALHSSQTAQILWAAAKMNTHPHWLPAALQALRADMGDASFADLCLAAWAVARLPPRHRPGDGFVTDLWAATSAHLGALTPLTASQLGFAVSAGLSVRPPDRWTEAYLQQTQHLLPQCAGGELRQIFSGVSLMLAVPADWLSAFWAAVQARCQLPDGMSTAELTGIMQSAARMGCDIDSTAMDVIQSAAETSISQFSNAALALLLWTLVKLGRLPDVIFLDGLVAETRRRLEGAADGSGWTMESLWLLLSSLAELRHRPSDAWLRAFDAAALPLLAGASAKELSRLIWAHAVLDANPGAAWLKAFDSRCTAQLSSFNTQGLANTCWALVVLQAYDCAALPRLWARWLARMAEGGEAAALDWVQLAEVAVVAARERPGLLQEMGSGMAEAARARWAGHVQAQRSCDSSSHNRVAARLQTDLRVPFKRSKMCSQSARLVDLALEVDQLRLAVMVDGPALFTRNTWQQTGSARLRDRSLALAGWRVVVLPWFALEGLRDPAACSEYLRRRLAEAAEAEVRRQTAGDS